MMYKHITSYVKDSKGCSITEFTKETVNFKTISRKHTYTRSYEIS